jgi:hypothetical protein
MSVQHPNAKRLFYGDGDGSDQCTFALFVQNAARVRVLKSMSPIIISANPNDESSEKTATLQQSSGTLPSPVII